MKVGDVMKHNYNGPYKVSDFDNTWKREVVDSKGAPVCWCGHEDEAIAQAQALMIVGALNNAADIEKHFTSLLDGFSTEFDARFANEKDEKL